MVSVHLCVANKLYRRKKVNRKALSRIRTCRIRKFLGLPDPLVRSTYPNPLRILPSFLHPAKIVRKTFISTVLWLLYDFLSQKNYINVPSRSKKPKKYTKLFFCWRLEGHWQKEQDPEPDPLLRGMDPRIWIPICTKTNCRKEKAAYWGKFIVVFTASWPTTYYIAY